MSIAAPIASEAAPADVTFGAGRQRFLDTENVELALVNGSSKRIELFGGGIYSRRTGERIVRLEPKRRFLPPGDEHRWVWTTSGRAGRFVARMDTSVGRFVDRFERGAFFTLGFEGSQDRFTIWVRERAPIAELRADLQRAQDERRIVSGIVSRAKGYNPQWSYTMGPASIVLGDAFIEVCDASPTYVEEHRDEWMGQRWCPWSSYVATEGR